MQLTEQFIRLAAPNTAAAENGRKLSQKGSFSALQKTQDGSLYWAQCAGSGKKPYQVSVDWADADHPVCRCSCPSRQFPCKHALGLMFEMLAQKPFAVAELPAEIAAKRAKQAARAAKKEADPAPKAPKKPNAAARRKKAEKQLEGLAMARRMLDDLLLSGLGSLAGSSAQSYDKLAKDLGGYYLTGPQAAFGRIALAVRALQKDPAMAPQWHAEALRTLIALHSTIQKAGPFLERQLEAGQFTAEDTALFEALGGVWHLDELRAAGLCRENVRLAQLSFEVSYDKVKKELVERGFWIDLDTGRIDQTLNLRPERALKHTKGEDSCFALLETPVLYHYPGEGNRRIRWETAALRPLTAQEQASLPTLAQDSLASALKAAKGQFKNTLAPKTLAALLPVGQLGRVGETFVLQDPGGDRIVLRDRAQDGPDHASTARLGLLPQTPPTGSALFGLLYYDEAGRAICLHPYSLVTPVETIRLLY